MGGVLFGLFRTFAHANAIYLNKHIRKRITITINNTKTMKKFTLILASLFLTIGAAWAQTELSLITTDGSANTFANATWSYHNSTSGSWYGKIVTNTTPAITIEEVGKNDNPMGWSTSNNIRRPWLKTEHSYTISIPEAYKITGYTLTTQSVSANYTGTFEYTTADGTATSAQQAVNTNKTITVEGLDVQQIDLTINGGSAADLHGILITGLTITYKFATTTATINYTLTDEAGNNYTGSYEGVANETEPTFTGAAGYSLENKAWNGNMFTADIVFPITAISKEGGITNKTMIANYQSTQKWHAVDGQNVKVQTTTPSLTKIDEWMWAIYPTLENGAFTFKVKNIATGKFVTANKTTSSFNTQGTVTLTEEGTSLEVITWLGSPCFKLPGQNVYLTINSDSDTDVYLATWTGGNNNHNGNKLHFPALTAYTFDITSAKAATLTTPIAVSCPDGVTAGYVSDVDTEKKTLEYTDVTTIPAGESVVLFGETGTYTFNATNEAAAFESTNYLVGYSEATDISEGQTVYALGNKNNVVAFYKFTGTQYAAHKAYLQFPEATEAAMFSLGRGNEGTTGIQNSEFINQNSTFIYDLAGRRVEKMEKGIYIVNGKKVVVK